MAVAVVPSHQSLPQPAVSPVINHLATTAFLHSPSVSPPLPTTSITLRSPLRYKKPSKAHQKPNLESLLSFFGLGFPHLAREAPPLVDGHKFELHTLPVDAKAVADGDTVTVYVDTSDTWESSRVPKDVQMAVAECNEARDEKNYTKVDALHKKIMNAGYRVLRINNEDILARKYRIRLRGIDAPEKRMPYGKKAKDELVKIIDGKCLKILVFGEDRYGRFVGDIYCNGIFVQESMLKKGLAWHYTAYDKRPELDKWEKDARVKRIGLWGSSQPEMPWEWRKNRREAMKVKIFSN